MTTISTGLCGRVLLSLAAMLCLPAAGAADTASCKYLNIGELPLRFMGNNFQPMVQGSINDQPATMLVDTGSGTSALTPTGVERLDLNPHITGAHTEGIGGTSRVYGVRLSEFGIGPAHVKRLALRVIGDMGAPPDFDAIVGADFLFQADIEISLAEHAVRFFRPIDCDKNSFLAYWTKQAVVVPLTGSFGTSRNNTITVLLNGVEVDAIIDTGASRSTVFEWAARKAGVQADHATSRQAASAVGVGSDIVRQRSAIFTTFAIGGETIRDAELTISPDLGLTGRQLGMLLGADFLRSHRILFASSQRQLYVTYEGGDVFTRDARGIPDWLQREADSGNPDAQYALASRYAAGRLVARDPDKAMGLLELAAAQNHQAALSSLADQRMRAKRYADGAALYRRAVLAQPNNRRAWMMLYLAQLSAGDGAQAALELDQRLAADTKHPWPAPVGDYFLGRLDAPGLLAAAGKEEALAAARRCESQRFMLMLAGAKGDEAQLKALAPAVTAACKAPAS